jgi:hypothetical protein
MESMCIPASVEMEVTQCPDILFSEAVLSEKVLSALSFGIVTVKLLN